MAVGDITKIPAAGVNIDRGVVGLCGTSTTMYYADNRGMIKSLTTTGTVADLTTKVILDGKPSCMCYTGVSSKEIAVCLDDGRVYLVANDGGTITKVADLQGRATGIYYTANYLYVTMASSSGNPMSGAAKIQIA